MARWWIPTSPSSPVNSGSVLSNASGCAQLSKFPFHPTIPSWCSFLLLTVWRLFLLPVDLCALLKTSVARQVSDEVHVSTGDIKRWKNDMTVLYPVYILLIDTLHVLTHCAHSFIHWDAVKNTVRKVQPLPGKQPCKNGTFLLNPPSPLCISLNWCGSDRNKILLLSVTHRFVDLGWLQGRELGAWISWWIIKMSNLPLRHVQLLVKAMEQQRGWLEGCEVQGIKLLPRLTWAGSLESKLLSTAGVQAMPGLQRTK